jgi:hypothetical protein
MTHLDHFLDRLQTSLPEICRDADLVTYIPDIFRNACNLTRMRARKQSPKYFYIDPHYYYLKADVIDWLKNSYNIETKDCLEECVRNDSKA